MLFFGLVLFLAVLCGICQLSYSGGYCGGVPPLPIPNREVKPACADGTAMQCGRVGGCRLYPVRLWSARTAASFFISRFFIFVKSCFSSETGLLCVLCPDGTRQQQASHLAAVYKSLRICKCVTWLRYRSRKDCTSLSMIKLSAVWGSLLLDQLVDLWIVTNFIANVS